MISTIYRGAVKDLLGPVVVKQTPAIVFEYSDSFSMLDWGRMPDLLPKKGEALACLAADLFERLEQPETWKEFSKTPGALALRKGNRVGSVFNEIGEELQSQGLETHYLGVLRKSPEGSEVEPNRLSQLAEPTRRLVVKQASTAKPTLTTVLGRSLTDYYPTRMTPAPRLIPLDVFFRFNCLEGSPFAERVSRDPNYLASLGFPGHQQHAHASWDFPVLELFTQLESINRPVPLSEALATTGLSAPQLQEILLKTAWVAGYLRSHFQTSGLELVDGKLEWALSEEGKCFLVNALGPDELNLLKNGVSLSRNFLQPFYRGSQWYQNVTLAKAHAQANGIAEWKRFVPKMPPPLPTAYRELAAQLYMSVSRELTGKNWFSEAWGVDKVIREIERLGGNQFS